MYVNGDKFTTPLHRHCQVHLSGSAAFITMNGQMDLLAQRITLFRVSPVYRIK